MQRVGKRFQYMVFLIVVLLCSPFSTSWAQAFGQNKVKHRSYNWLFIKTKHFDIYFYQGEEFVAKAAAKIAEDSYESLRKDFQYSITRRIPIILYDSHNSFEETNVILENIEEEVGGFTEYFKNRVVLPFEGSYSKLRHVIHHELTHAVMFDMLYGGVLESLMSRQYLFRMPLWFAEGLAEYESLRWDTEADMIMRDVTLSGNLPPINEIQGGYLAYKGGESIFRFIANKYGIEKIREILSKTRMTKSIEKSIKSSLNINLEDLSKEWQKNLKREYWPEIAKRQEAEEFAKRLTNHKQEETYINRDPAFSPHGDKIAFLSDRSDYKDIYIMSAIDGKILTRVTRGERSGEYEEMHWLRGGITWSPDGTEIAFASKSGEKDVIFLHRVRDGKTIKKFKFDLDAIFSPDWSPDGNNIVFTGLKDGASDLYVVELKSGELSQLTHDYFDEADPKWSKDSKKIAFTSDRIIDVVQTDSLIEKDSLIKGNYNIFTINADGSGVEKITNSPGYNLSPSWSPDGKEIAFVSDRNGIYNIYILNLETKKVTPITDVLSGCFEPSWSPDGKKMAFSSFQEGGWDIFIIKDVTERIEKAKPLEPTMFVSKPQPDSSITAQMDDVGMKAASDSLLETPNLFGRPLTEARLPAGLRAQKERQVVIDTLAVFDSEGRYAVQPYKIKFSPDIIAATAQYSSFSGLGGQTAIAMSDVLGNHRIFFYTDLFYTIQDSDFLLSYYFLPRRIEYGVTLFHTKSYYLAYDELTDNAEWFSDRMYGGGISFSRPFSKFTRIDFTPFVFAIDRQYYDTNVFKRTRALLFDLTLVNDTAVWGQTAPVNGSRSVWSVQHIPDIEINTLGFTTFTMDWQRYQRLTKSYNFVVRLSGGVSVGRNPQRFFLGGTNNWINPQYSRTDILGVEDLYFASFPAPLRGTKYYELSGTRYGLLNIELRYPLIRYLSLGWPIPLTFGDVGGEMFLDVGSAWSNDEKFRAFSQSESGMLHLEDLKAGYGMGAQINLGIALLRFDVAWKTDFVSSSAKPRYYFSLGQEF